MDEENVCGFGCLVIIIKMAMNLEIATITNAFINQL